MKMLFCTVFAAISAAAQTTIPMIVEGNVPIVELKVGTSPEHARMARFMVDSGGGAFIIGSKLLADSGAKTQGPIGTQDDDKMQAASGLRAWAGGLELNLEGVPEFAKLEGARIIERNEAEGMIPGRLLSKYYMIFDYPGHTLTFAPPGTVEPRGVKLKADIGRTGFPRIEAEVGGQTYGFMIDTGASFTMVSRAAMEQWSKANPSWMTATGAFGFANMGGGRMEADALMLRIFRMRLGPGVFTIPQTEAVSRPEGTFEKNMSRMMTAPIIGSIAGNVWRDFRLEIDYQNGFVYLAKPGVSPLEISGVGLVLGPGKNGLRVSAIASTSAADVKSSVHVGDELAAVDGVDMTGKPLAFAAEALLKPGASRKLALLRNGERVEVTVTCAKLL